MFFITEVPRDERTVEDYFNALISDAGRRCIKLGIFTSQQEFSHAIVDPTYRAVAAGELTGDLLWDKARKGLFPEFIGKDNLPAFWASACVAYSSEAVAAWKMGRVAAAWSFIVDAGRCCDGVLEGAHDLETAERAVKDNAKRGAAEKKARDPKQAAKNEAFDLWQERHAGKHPRLRTNEQFATECMHRWPVLTSAKVICSWCTVWTKEAKAKKIPAC